MPEDLQKSSPIPLLRVGVEFSSGILAGILVGLGIDYLFATSPWGILGGFFLGIGAGILNLFRILTVK